MTRYELLKFVHVLSAVIWVGGGLLALVFAIRATKASREHRVGLGEDMAFVGDRVFFPASVLVLLFGVLMVLDADALSFGDTWILLGLGGIAVSIALGVGALTPLVKRFNADIESGGDGVGPLTRITRVALLDNLVLLVVVWAMVTKPGA